jgi:SWI/SNF-related matrix-associated actin-dependent regulator 1 of chromatin subfamily A
LTRELFHYQIVGRDWLARQKTCLLADEPRLGKAVQCIAALDKLQATAALVVCRGVARSNWADEFGLWSKREWRAHCVYGRSAPIPFRGDDRPFVVVCNYENLEYLLTQLPADYKFDAAIIDESHYVKNLEAKRTRAVLGREGVPKVANRIWATTGTPTPNGLATELWPLLYVFGATKLSFWDFAKKFCIVEDTGYGPRIAGTRMEPGPITELRSILAKKMLRRTASEVSVQLPKMSFSTVMVPPGKVELKMTIWWKYAMREGGEEEFNALIARELGIMNGLMDDGKLSHELLETLKAQAKSISTLRKYTALQKLDAAIELIGSELEAGAYQKCVIFAYHIDAIKGAQRMLHRFHPVTMYGGSNPLRTAQNIKNFQNPKNKCRVFIVQISAAGTSISVSAANHIFFLEESFVPDDNLQAAYRCGGVNQPNPVFIRTFCLENSYDYRLQNIIREKMSQSAAIYGSTLTSPSVPPELEDLI